MPPTTGLDTFNASAASFIIPIVKGMDDLNLWARKRLRPEIYASLEAIIRLPEYATKVGAAALVAAVMAGNPPETNIDKDMLLNDLCVQGSTAQQRIVCQQIAELRHLSFQEKLMAASLVNKYKDDIDRLSTISAIIKASERTNVDLKTALTIATIESSLGKNVTANTSSAKGIFQYIDSTWLDSFKKHKDKPGLEKYKDLTDEETIKSLRTTDLDAHALVALYDLAEKHPQILRKPPAPAERLKLDAYAAHLGQAYELMMIIPRRMADIVRYDHHRDDPDHVNTLALEEFKKHAAAKIYLTHFLGDSGAKSFFDILNSKQDRNKKFLLASEEFKAAAESNKPLFGGGQYSYIEVYSRILDIVDGAQGMIDKVSHEFAQRFQGRLDTEIGRQLNKPPSTIEELLAQNPPPP